VKNLLQNIEKIITPFLDSKGVELVELKAIGSGGRSQTLKVVVWRQGGIDLEGLSNLSRNIGDLLEAEDIIHGSFTLEVSSPGLDRILLTGEDFRRAEGEKVKIIFGDGSSTVGTVVSSAEGKVVIENETGREDIPLKDIVKGKIEIVF